MFKLSCFSFPGDLSAPESSELDLERKRQQLQDPVLMPLPGAGADGPLDWAHLVDAAKAFEGRHTHNHFLLEVTGRLITCIIWKVWRRHPTVIFFLISPQEGSVSLYFVFSPGLIICLLTVFFYSEQRLVFLAAQEESSVAESAAATSPQQAEPQAAPLRQPSPG